MATFLTACLPHGLEVYPAQNREAVIHANGCTPQGRPASMTQDLFVKFCGCIDQDGVGWRRVSDRFHNRDCQASFALDAIALVNVGGCALEKAGQEQSVKSNSGGQSFMRGWHPSRRQGRLPAGLRNRWGDRDRCGQHPRRQHRIPLRGRLPESCRMRRDQ